MLAPHEERRLLPNTWASEFSDVDMSTVHCLWRQRLNTPPAPLKQYEQNVTARYKINMYTMPIQNPKKSASILKYLGLSLGGDMKSCCFLIVSSVYLAHREWTNWKRLVGVVIENILIWRWKSGAKKTWNSRLYYRKFKFKSTKEWWKNKSK